MPRKVLDSLLPPGSVGSCAASTPKVGGNLVSKAAARVGIQKTVSVKETTPKPPSAAKPSPDDRGVVSKALAIIAEEIGLDVKELRPESKFADYGVDSLLSLTIVGRFREELNKDLESSFFLENPTVTNLIHCLSEDSESLSDSSTESQSSIPQYTPASLGPDDDGPEEDSGTMGSIRQTLAEEIGMPAEEIKGNLRLSELGMDSLLALTVRGRLQEELEIELPSDLFLGDATLDKIAEALGLTTAPAAIPPVPPVQISISKPATAAPPKATSILLQGNATTARKLLFLFPDGSGSSTSYASLPPLGADIAVIGLNCPFMKTPHLMPGNLAATTPLYLAELRRRQPRGPYSLGGWSAGGVCAYDAAQTLLAQGEAVERLLFLDSPCPIGLGKLPPRLYEFFNSINLFGGSGGDPPEWLLPHFLAFIDALDAYKAAPLAAGGNGHGQPKTWMVWATDGVCKNPGDRRPEYLPGDPKEMRWLLENRVDFGANGWEKLLGRGLEGVVIETMEGVNHFSMMEGEGARRLGEFVRRAMA